MIKRLLFSSRFFQHETTGLVSIFLLVRFVSLLTYHEPFLNQCFAAILIAGFAYISIKNLALAWMILILELILGGSGHYFEFHTLILRTWFLGIFGLTWLFKQVKEKTIVLTILPRPLMMSIIAVGITILFATINGIINGNVPIHVVQDTILYLFLALLFPAIELRKYLPQHLSTIVKTFVIGSAIFTILTFIIYSSGLGSLPDYYYHWFRNVAAGKITDLGNNFYRIVFPEHLLLVPIILLLAARLIEKIKERQTWLLFFLSLIVLVLNFSRIYFLALVIGLLVLSIKQRIKPWLVVSTVTGITITVLFMFFNITASGGNTLGLELISSRFGTAAAPQSDVSSATRLMILPEAVELIKKNPLIGSGLGTSVTFVDPALDKEVTRTQFDLGYHEMIVELGVLGFTMFLGFLCTMLYYLAQLAYSKQTTSDTTLTRGLFAGALSLFIINLTTPALFHGFSMILYIFILVLISNHTTKVNVSS